MAVLSFLPWSPITPIIQILPLLIVLAVSMLKSGIEDLMRYRNDIRENSIIYDVFDRKTTSFEKKKSMDIKPGDIIRITNEQQIPSDVVIIGVSSNDGISYINEVNLNGETALKQKRCLFGTRQPTPEFQAEVRVPKPNQDILKLDGNLKVDNHNFPFSIKNCYLRGSVLMHTSWALGVVLYSGHDTRIIQNQRKAPHKTSVLEHRLNQLTIANFTIMFIFVFLMTILAVHDEKHLDFAWVVKIDSMVSSFFQNFIANAILLSYLIPISLYVTIEVVRFFQRWIFGIDLGMCDSELGYSQVHNSNLNEDLGVIDHIFSDKTGTLTENKMDLVSAYINNTIYDLKNPTEKTKQEATHGPLLPLLINIGICNSVVLTNNEISSESPDEEALVKKAGELNVKLTDKNLEFTTLSIAGNDEKFRLLTSIDFTSARKRMSVLVRDKDGIITLYSKGADSIMLGLLKKDQDPSQLQKIVDDYANKGLRTLVMCKRVVTEEEYAAWKEEYDASFVALENRDENVAAAGAKIEHEFELIGAVAIEDALQPDVGPTIAFLSRMGINLWVLTGDKKETAISIGKSTCVISKDSKIISFDEPDNKDSVFQEVQRENKSVLVIGPSALESVFDTDFLPNISEFCKSVICYRMSPSNKARVVETMRKFTTKRCLSVGDGANDVSMIQAAHVGIGIFGREGHQAASISDFAITRFKHLKRLLAVHGRLSLVRISGTILYMFAKNIVLIFPQVWFSYFTKFSPVTIYNDFLLTTYNMAWTALPPLIYGMFEQDVSPESMLKYPHMYAEARAGRYMSWWRIMLEMLCPLYQSVIIFVFCFYLPTTVISDPYNISSDFACCGFISFFAVILVSNIQLAIRSHHWNYYIFLSIYLSVFIFLLFSIAYAAFPTLFPLIFGVPQQVLTTWQMYINLLIALVLCLLPEPIFRYLKALWFPSYSRLIREGEIFQEKERNIMRAKLKSL
ncbi:phospholipid-translocating P-type ATPase, flippase family protein [Trichomonas vaginalis G3]|uniref:Phospholipid-transporting ATPase n=1 Tax=Trichomonas vaginalis (strain ATCC PRA-98 / G3) TaxID=412133 RepID=A2EYU3_TRIV3|nr:putative phospholipid-transporting ATPase family [Trichomonas vaginalis G3]EAY02162.1 phospholipid-translocating P-type ATPase, flippase family protein [Trichomonas vaginalis G3]KAI5554259.1 putative phospholipid-transporting ATPase family [Trichomonas vaginalis G3]|eukprot:XP_001330565.1 phospholipid-translocating P-type ATPase, flippase family protein [Trichomonas vaginalis G3]